MFFDGRFLTDAIYRREGLVPGDAIRGPAMVTEYTAATVVAPGCSVQVDGFGNLILTIGEEERR